MLGIELAPQHRTRGEEGSGVRLTSPQQVSVQLFIMHGDKKVVFLSFKAGKKWGLL